MKRYNRRMLWAAFAYVFGLGIAITLDKQLNPGAAIRFALALLPILPIFAMIWGMGRYLVEEQDEYLRHRTIVAALGGLGLVLGLGSFWGFLETFGLAPHAPGWWAVPVFALGLGLGQLWMKVTGK
jgi:Mn2+/Fe2+ NRAMP family transporter